MSKEKMTTERAMEIREYAKQGEKEGKIINDLIKKEEKRISEETNKLENHISINFCTFQNKILVYDKAIKSMDKGVEFDYDRIDGETSLFEYFILELYKDTSECGDFDELYHIIMKSAYEKMNEQRRKITNKF